MESFNVRILASERKFYEGPLESLIIPTPEGQYGIQAGHCNIMSAIVPGVMTYRLPGKPDEKAALSSGIVKVEDGEVLILVDTAERPEEIDEFRAARRKAEAKEAMLQELSRREQRQAEATLARAISRINAKRGMDI